MPLAYPVDLPGSWWFTELPPSEVVRKGGALMGAFLSGFILGAFALAVVALLTISIKTKGSQ
jgi:hypothetical protein